MLISVHGTIGAGKTTIINYLKDRGVTTFCEPVEEWKDELIALYTAVTPQEKEQAIIGIQDAAYKNMLNIYNCIKEDPNKIYFIERSCWDTFSIFVPLNQELYLNKKIYDYHIERAEKLEKLFETVTPNRVKIFVRTTLEKAIHRTKNRNDGFDIDVAYQERLFNLHEEAFEKCKNDNNVVNIDNSEDKMQNELGKFNAINILCT